MSVRISAPYPTLQTTSILPNPEFSNSENLRVELDIHRAIDGTVRTYVKKKYRQRRGLRWTFRLTRNKAIELREFLLSYHSSEFLVDDHEGRRWRAYVLNNPVDITMSNKAGPARHPWPVGETCTVQLEMAAELISGDFRSARQPELDAVSLVEAEDNVSLDMEIPAIAGLQHDWDALNITPQADASRLSSWSDAGPLNVPLVPYSHTYFGASFDANSARPRYYNNVFGSHPGVLFATETIHMTANPAIRLSGTAAMRSNSAVNFFPNRRGTVFFVYMHTVGGAPDWDNAWSKLLPEFALWGIQIPGQTFAAESFNLGAGGHTFAPATWRMQPENLSVYPTIHAEQQLIPRGHPFLYTVQRDSDTNLRVRINGIEKDGRLIPNNQGATGTLLMNVATGNTGFTAVSRGFWGQLIDYNRVLTSVEIDRVEAALAAKWGICLGEDITEFSDCFRTWCYEWGSLSAVGCHQGEFGFDPADYNMDIECGCGEDE